jgi:acetyl-CoA C-acetyltransferase
MADCYVYDHVRTPRGRGKPDGALHSVTALELATQVLVAVRERNELDTGALDDVVMGCVDPVGEAGGDIARAAVLNAGYDQSVAGIQINRFCASGLDAVNFAAAEIMSGQHDMAVGGGVESMSRIGIGASGGAWPVDPSIALKSYYLPQGVSADLIATKHGFSRDEVDAYAVESQQRASASWQSGHFGKSVVPVRDVNNLTILDRDEHMRPDATMQSLGALKPSFAEMGDAFTASMPSPSSATPSSRPSSTCIMRATPQASSTGPPRCWWARRRPASGRTCAPGPASGPSPTSARSPRSCSPARPTCRARCSSAPA